MPPNGNYFVLAFSGNSSNLKGSLLVGFNDLIV